MKKFIFFSFIAMLLISSKAPETIKWYSLTEGIEIARRENKPMLLFIYVPWCDKCQRMDNKVFTSKEVMPLITEHFIAVKMNPEVDSAYFRSDKILDRKVFLSEITPGKLAISVPTTVFYRGEGDESTIMNGIQDPTELKENIQLFLKK